MLVAAEKHFMASLASEANDNRATFGLGPNEYLFNSEGFGIGAAITTLFSTYSVRAFTVGELYDAVLEVQQPKSQRQ